MKANIRCVHNTKNHPTSSSVSLPVPPSPHATPRLQPRRRRRQWVSSPPASLKAADGSRRPLGPVLANAHPLHILRHRRAVAAAHPPKAAKIAAVPVPPQLPPAPNPPLSDPHPRSRSLAMDTLEGRFASLVGYFRNLPEGRRDAQALRARPPPPPPPPPVLHRSVPDPTQRSAPPAASKMKLVAPKKNPPPVLSQRPAWVDVGPPTLTAEESETNSVSSEAESVASEAEMSVSHSYSSDAEEIPSEEEAEEEDMGMLPIRPRPFSAIPPASPVLAHHPHPRPSSCRASPARTVASPEPDTVGGWGRGPPMTPLASPVAWGGSP